MRDSFSIAMPAIVQEDERRATVAKKELERYAETLADCEFQVGDLLAEIDAQCYWQQWGFFSFKDYLANSRLDMTERVAQYRIRISKGATALGITREQLKAAKVSKLREIFTLDAAQYADDIKRLVDAAPSMTVEEIKHEVKRAKGLAGEEDFVHRNFYVLRSVAVIVDRALEAARKVGGDTISMEGEAKDLSDGQCLEQICADFLAGTAEYAEHEYAIKEEGPDPEEPEPWSGASESEA